MLDLKEVNSEYKEFTKIYIPIICLDTIESKYLALTIGKLIDDMAGLECFLKTIHRNLFKKKYPRSMGILDKTYKINSILRRNKILIITEIIPISQLAEFYKLNPYILFNICLIQDEKDRIVYNKFAKEEDILLDQIGQRVFIKSQTNPSVMRLSELKRNINKSQPINIGYFESDDRLQEFKYLNYLEELSNNENIDFKFNIIRIPKNFNYIESKKYQKLLTIDVMLYALHEDNESAGDNHLMLYQMISRYIPTHFIDDNKCQKLYGWKIKNSYNLKDSIFDLRDLFPDRFINLETIKYSIKKISYKNPDLPDRCNNIEEKTLQNINAKVYSEMSTLLNFIEGVLNEKIG